MATSHQSKAKIIATKGKKGNQKMASANNFPKYTEFCPFPFALQLLWLSLSVRKDDRNRENPPTHSPASADE